MDIYVHNSKISSLIKLSTAGCIRKSINDGTALGQRLYSAEQCRASKVHQGRCSLAAKNPGTEHSLPFSSPFFFSFLSRCHRVVFLGAKVEPLVTPMRRSSSLCSRKQARLHSWGRLGWTKLEEEKQMEICGNQLKIQECVANISRKKHLKTQEMPEED